MSIFRQKKTVVSASDLGAVTYCPMKKYHQLTLGVKKGDGKFMQQAQKKHDKIIRKRARLISKTSIVYMISLLVVIGLLAYFLLTSELGFLKK